MLLMRSGPMPKANRSNSTAVDLHVPRAPITHVSRSAKSSGQVSKKPVVTATEMIFTAARIDRTRLSRECQSCASVPAS